MSDNRPPADQPEVRDAPVPEKWVRDYAMSRLANMEGGLYWARKFQEAVLDLAQARREARTLEERREANVSRLLNPNALLKTGSTGRSSAAAQ